MRNRGPSALDGSIHGLGPACKQSGPSGRPVPDPRCWKDWLRRPPRRSCPRPPPRRASLRGGPSARAARLAWSETLVRAVPWPARRTCAFWWLLSIDLTWERRSSFRRKDRRSPGSSPLGAGISGGTVRVGIAVPRTLPAPRFARRNLGICPSASDPPQRVVVAASALSDLRINAGRRTPPNPTTNRLRSRRLR